ncbi:hypothetical protein NW752_011167 [Fusarium irregulare]|uniref:GATA-type domain-containing protein n=1 Tax=Fusarium irregulare TaxID=2494466 RepID=A0A9W8PF06_9HYPO|nr:hypothetical protein NW766_012196 [Fusarium irregulare]KAJ4005837.1 hypothetical protein NW752_011167 [Fusarium irregulare]
MIPSVEETLVEPRNFFLPRAPTNANANADANLIHTTKLLQDAHALRQLAQSHDIDQFLNNPSPIDEATIDFANDITSALGDALRATPLVTDTDTPTRPGRRPKRLSRQSTANSVSSVGGSSARRKSKRCCLCGVTNSPRWQEAGFGRRVFCNVCGLLHSKRIVRKILVQSSRGDTASTTDSAWS